MVTHPIAILVGGIAVSLDLVHGTEPLRQLRRELIVELAPVFVADLCLEAVKDLKIYSMLVMLHFITQKFNLHS